MGRHSTLRLILEGFPQRRRRTGKLNVRLGPGSRPPNSQIAPDWAAFVFVSASVVPPPARHFAYYRIQEPRILSGILLRRGELIVARNPMNSGLGALNVTKLCEIIRYGDTHELEPSEFIGPACDDRFAHTDISIVVGRAIRRMQVGYVSGARTDEKLKLQ